MSCQTCRYFINKLFLGSSEAAFVFLPPGRLVGTPTPMPFSDTPLPEHPPVFSHAVLLQKASRIQLICFLDSRGVGTWAFK